MVPQVPSESNSWSQLGEAQTPKLKQSETEQRKPILKFLWNQHHPVASAFSIRIWIYVVINSKHPIDVWSPFERSLITTETFIHLSVLVLSFLKKNSINDPFLCISFSIIPNFSDISDFLTGDTEKPLQKSKLQTTVDCIFSV